MPDQSLADYQREIADRMRRREWPAAAAATAACRAAWPASAAGWLLGSIVALARDQAPVALRLIEERLATDPADFQCLLQQAECLFALGRRDEALAAATAAAAAADTPPQALDAVGEFLGFAREHRRALEIYNRAVALAPRDPALRSKRAILHRYLGELDLAVADYDALLAIVPNHADALKGRAELFRQSTDRNAITAMEAALAAGPANPTEAATLHFALAKSYEDLGEHAANWRHLSVANGLERARIQYNADIDRAVIDKLVAAFARSEMTAPDTTGESPIFIVGLPRSGTTLVERILGSHSQVHSAGELSALSEAIGTSLGKTTSLESLDWVAFAAALGDLDGAPIAGDYLARSRSRRGDRPRFSDKQPTNFYHCALIFRAFPAARIVHLTRHPLAACYAIYKNRFLGTFPFAYHLGELAEFYVGYRRLMAHWHTLLPGRILDVAYEDIVTAQAATTRRLLEYVGLDFEPACLDFHLNPASTTTASSVQVRQPLYDTSRDQWRHYAAQLTPVRERLAAAGIEVE